MKQTDKEIIAEIKELQNQISEKTKALEKIFKDGLTVLLSEYKSQIDSITIHINNHEFNDGDPTYFSLNYDDLTLNYQDELGNEYEYEPYNNDANNKALGLIHKTLVDFFKAFDTKDFYEGLFGDRYDSITFEVKDDKLKIS